MVNDRLLDITLRQLVALREAANSPTWAVAAERVGVTPSALSQSLAELERRLGIPLFEPDGRRRRLREQAREVLAFANRVTAQTGDLRDHLDAVRNGHRGRLRVGMIDAAALYRLPGAIRSLREQRPEVEVEVVVDNTSRLMDLIDRGELDLAVVVSPNHRLRAEPHAYRTCVLLAEPFSVYSPSPAASLAEGSGARWVSYPRDSNTRGLTDVALAGAGIVPQVVTESGNPDVLVQLVRLGVGWALLPVDVAERGPDPLHPVPGGALLRRTLCAVERADRPADPLRAQLTAELVTEAEAPNPRP
ncbi:MAG: LysR family transcriptional regulator [Acidimicrobiales bacterium]